MAKRGIDVVEEVIRETRELIAAYDRGEVTRGDVEEKLKGLSEQLRAGVDAIGDEGGGDDG